MNTPTPNTFRRFLDGSAAGQRIHMQGVIYPSEISTAEKRITTPPAWGITTAEAARLLGGISAAGARDFLHKQGVRHVIVREIGKVPMLYRNARKVHELAAAKVPRLYEMPRGFMLAADVCKHLGCSRSTLFRYVERGLLTSRRFFIRRPTRGKDEKWYHADLFDEKEVCPLALELHQARLLERQAAAHRAAARARLAERKPTAGEDVA